MQHIPLTPTYPQSPPPTPQSLPLTQATYLTIPTHPKKVSAYPRVPALTEITFLNTSSHHYNISKYLAYLKTGLYLSNILGDLIFLEKSLGLKRLNTFKNWFHEILLMERRKYKVKLLVQQITRNYLIEI